MLLRGLLLTVLLACMVHAGYAVERGEVVETPDTVNPLDQWLRDSSIPNAEAARAAVAAAEEQAHKAILDPAGQLKATREQEADVQALVKAQGQSAQGKLFVFFSVSAPNIHYLPQRLTALQRSHPRIGIQAVSFDGPGSFVNTGHEMDMWSAQQKELLEGMRMQLGSLRESNESQWKKTVAKLNEQIEADRYQRFGWLNDMAQYYQTPGIPVMDNITPALALQVTEVPTFYFISREGVVHHLRGVGKSTDLGAWVDKSLDWERRKLAEAKAQLEAP